MREGDVVYLLVMTGVSEFRGEVDCVDPVNVGLRATTEEVSIISSEGNGSDVAHYFGLV